VTESKAVQKGLSNSPGALKGTQISAFIHGSHKLSCSKIKGFVKGKLKETCCDGSGNAPCLWKTGYYLSKVKTSSGSKMKGRGEITSIIADAKKMFKKKEYSKIGYKYGYRGRDFPYEVEFQYYVGMSYFIQEDCEKAKNFFNRIHTAYGRGKANLAFKSMIKKASYNFAVCHAREGDAIGATSILDGMKLDRKFFSKEISRARYDGNFGRIKNTKEWKKFMSN
jgi:hypothetical protein